MKMSHMVTRDGCSLTVRRLQSGDEAALSRFYAELSPASRGMFMAHALDNDTLAKVTARSEAGDDLVLGLFDGQRMVGYFFLWYYRERVPLLGIGMLDEYQGRGLGRQMMELLIAAARENGNEGIELTTQQENDRAFALYRKVGFEYYGDVENLQGEGKIVVERAMFYCIKSGALPMDKPHAPPV